jgi:hypothetical protein
MWKTRNEAIHKIETSEVNIKNHKELDQEITDMFRKLLLAGLLEFDLGNKESLNIRIWHDHL